MEEQKQKKKRRLTKRGFIKHKKETNNKKETYFIDKEEFYEDIKAYLQENEEREVQGLDKLKAPDKIGLYFHRMIEYYLRSHRFRGYTEHWKDEMRVEAIFNCIKSLHIFNWRKHTNPFGYFTTTIWNVFYAVIAKNKRDHDKLIAYRQQFMGDYVETGADGFNYTIPEAVLNKKAGTEDVYDEFDLDFQERWDERRTDYDLDERPTYDDESDESSSQQEDDYLDEEKFN
nr:MAG TPA: RNA polymerase sigma factor [Caudoviricetes sp.]